VKLVTEEVAKDYGVLWAVKREEADSCARLAASRLVTIQEQQTGWDGCKGDLQALRGQYGDLYAADRRKARKGPWIAVGAFVLGVLLGSR
jgi:hypothetical protein